MEYRVLGPLTALTESGSRPLGGRRQRMVLAVLLANANRVVSQDALIDAVWSGEPPEAAKTTLQSYISHLRRELGGGVVRQGDGYRVDVNEPALDAQRFQEQVEQGRRLLATDPARALATLQSALGLWYGAPYGDLGTSAALLPEVARLEELRMATVESRIEADLALGNHRIVIGELDTLVRDHPFRERLWALRMLALYRSGRQADALRAYQRLRSLLADELGIDPSAELRDLEQQILEQDPALAFEEPVSPATEGRRNLRGYELRDQIGEGDYGIVYRAFQPSVGREVAIKVIRPEYVNQASFIRRFEAEAQLVAQLEHPHAVPLFDFWRDPEGAYLVMPLLRGGNLHTALQRGPWNLSPALSLLEQVGAAVGYAHRQGVLHRDIKPGNVLLDEEGNAYLSDFGVATRLFDEQGSPLTTSRAYLAPEEIRGEPLTPRSDLFSLGVLTFHLLTGVHPVAGEAIPAISAIRPGIPEALDAVLRRTTDDQPLNRYEKVEDFLRAVRRAIGVDVVAVPQEAALPVSATPLRNPYKGLRAFLETDTLDFHGREALVDEMLRALDQHGLVAVVGPSGCGKSSAVRAGLVPALRAGALPGSRGWLITDMFPGSYPFEELEAALLRVAVERPSGLIDELTADDRGLLRSTKQILPADDSQLVLIIDQFEELFSNTASEETRRLFLESLRVVVSDSRRRVRVLLTLRADFFDRPLAYSEFAEIMQAGLVTVSPLAGEGLARAISGPARRVGVDLEPGLVGVIRADVEGEPGGLPLLQFALTELFERRQEGRLTIDAYEATGGVRRALGRRAEELHNELNSAGKEAARQLFLRLVTLDEAATVTRRRVRQAELRSLSVDQTALDQVLRQYGAFRLLSFDHHPVTRGPTVEVAHEALLLEWARLRGWIESQADDLTLHRRLAASAREWVESESDHSFLLRGARLEQAEQWVERGGMAVSTEEAEFVAASVRQRQAEQADARRRRRRLTTSLVGALAVMTALAGVAFLQSERAERESRLAAVWNLAASSRDVAEQDSELSLLLALAAMDQAGAEAGPASASAFGALDEAVTHARLEMVIEGAPSVLASAESWYATSTSADSGAANDVTIWSAESGEPVRVLPGENKVAAISISPDGTRIAVGYRTSEAGAPIVIWDPATGEEIARLAAPDQFLRELFWSPDGRLLGASSQHQPQLITVWEEGTWRESFTIESETAAAVIFKDRTNLIIAHPSTQMLTLHSSSTGALTAEIPTPEISPTDLAMDAEGRRVVLGSDTTRELQLWDLDGSPWLVWAKPARAPDVDVALTIAADSAIGLIAASGSDGSVQLFDFATGDERFSLARHPSLVDRMALVSDSAKLISGDSSGGHRVWDVTPGGPRQLSTPLGSVTPPCGFIFNPDGSEALAWTTGGEVVLLDMAAGQVLRTWTDQAVNFNAPVAVSPDWRTAAWRDEDGIGWTRDLATDKKLLQLPECTLPRTFSPDGELLVLSRTEGCSLGTANSGVIDTETGATELDLGRRVLFGAVFNPGGHFQAGRYLAIATFDTIEIFDMTALRLIAQTSLISGPMTFDPTGRYLAVSGDESDAHVFDLDLVVNGSTLEDAEIFGQPTNSDYVAGIALDGGGRLATSSFGMLRIWDVETGTLIAEPSVEIDTPPFPGFSPDGSYLAYIDKGPTLQKWFLDPEALLGYARSRVTRDLTPEECLRYFGPNGCP